MQNTEFLYIHTGFVTTTSPQIWDVVS